MCIRDRDKAILKQTPVATSYCMDGTVDFPPLGRKDSAVRTRRNKKIFQNSKMRLNKAEIIRKRKILARRKCNWIVTNCPTLESNNVQEGGNNILRYCQRGGNKIEPRTPYQTSVNEQPSTSFQALVNQSEMSQSEGSDESQSCTSVQSQSPQGIINSEALSFYSTISQACMPYMSFTQSPLSTQYKGGINKSQPYEVCDVLNNTLPCVVSETSVHPAPCETSSQPPLVPLSESLPAPCKASSPLKKSESHQSSVEIELLPQTESSDSSRPQPSVLHKSLKMCIRDSPHTLLQIM